MQSRVVVFAADMRAGGPSSSSMVAPVTAARLLHLIAAYLDGEGSALTYSSRFAFGSRLLAMQVRAYRSAQALAFSFAVSLQ
eukprot:568591-Prymnesium_polylepis.1